MVLELKKMGIELDMPASKLKAGHGEGVCMLLMRLCQVIVQGKIKFRKPVIKDEGGRDMDEEGDDNDDMEGNADIADMMMGGNQSDDDIEDFAELGGGGDKGDFDNPQNQMISSAIPREDWMLEVERVAHKLKIGSNLGNDGVKEWRNHLDQTKKYADLVR
jgi:hypothetical protein